MSDIPGHENVKSVFGIFDYLGNNVALGLAIIAGILGYGKIQATVNRHHEKLFDSNGNERYMTENHHVKLQEDCQALWKNEFKHIRGSLKEIKDDVREFRNNGRNEEGK